MIKLTCKVSTRCDGRYGNGVQSDNVEFVLLLLLFCGGCARAFCAVGLLNARTVEVFLGVAVLAGLVSVARLPVLLRRLKTQHRLSS